MSAVKHGPRVTLDDFPGETVSVEQAGLVLGIGRGAAYSAVRRGEIKTIKLGRLLLVSKHELARMLGAPNGPLTHEGPAANGTSVETSTIAHVESDHVVPRAY